MRTIQITSFSIRLSSWNFITDIFQSLSDWCENMHPYGQYKYIVWRIISEINIFSPIAILDNLPMHFWGNFSSSEYPISSQNSIFMVFWKYYWWWNKVLRLLFTLDQTMYQQTVFYCEVVTILWILCTVYNTYFFTLYTVDLVH